MKDLLELPIYLQIVIASGYAGYVIAQRDYRKNEKNTDVYLMILLLGLPSGLMLTLWKSPWAYTSALFAPILGFLWAKYGKQSLFAFLNRTGAAHENNEGSVWDTLATRKGVIITQITVTLKNGRKYHCSDTAKYYTAEFSPCLIDDDGIAFYVDSFVDSQGQWTTDHDVQSKMGALVSYFPRNDIALLEVRFKDN